MFQPTRNRALRRAQIFPALCVLPWLPGCASAIHGTTPAVVVNPDHPGSAFSSTTAVRRPRPVPFSSSESGITPW